MTDSILLTVKKMLGIAEEYHAFDLDIIININSVFLTLNQLGVGPKTPYQILGEEETWTDFVDTNVVPGIQTYVYLKTRLLFDPPTNSFLVDAIQKQIAELEWRMNVQVDTEYPSEEEPSEPDVPVEPTEPDEQDEFEELTSEEVREIYEGIKNGTIDLQNIEFETVDGMEELTPEEVKAIYETSIADDISQIPMAMSLTIDEPKTKASMKSIKNKLARIKRNRRSEGR